MTQIEHLQTDININRDHLDRMLSLYERLAEQVGYMARRITELEHARQTARPNLARVK